MTSFFILYSIVAAVVYVSLIMTARSAALWRTGSRTFRTLFTLVSIPVAFVWPVMGIVGAVRKGK